MKDRFILQAERRQITGISDVSWWRMEKQNQAPKRRQISPGRIAWLESEIISWMESRPLSTLSSPAVSKEQHDG